MDMFLPRPSYENFRFAAGKRLWISAEIIGPSISFISSLLNKYY